MAATQYLIVGGGLAAASAIEGIRELDQEGPITLLAAERDLPYHRPLLSKSFLAGKDRVWHAAEAVISSRVRCAASRSSACR